MGWRQGLKDTGVYKGKAKQKISTEQIPAWSVRRDLYSFLQNQQCFAFWRNTEFPNVYFTGFLEKIKKPLILEVICLFFLSSSLCNCSQSVQSQLSNKTGYGNHQNIKSYILITLMIHSFLRNALMTFQQTSIKERPKELYFCGYLISLA